MSNYSIYNILFIISYAVLWSWFEVEIEGPNGWAVSLPTGCAFLGWTYYHISMNCIVLLTLYNGIQFREFSNTTILFANEILFVSEFIVYILIWFVTEDVIWFMINPLFGIHKYRQSEIEWHSKKIWIMGTFIHNWVSLFICVLLSTPEIFIQNTYKLAFQVIVGSSFILCSCIASVFVRAANIYYTDNIPVVDKTGCSG